jgi:hypothetical protein
MNNNMEQFQLDTRSRLSKLSREELTEKFNQEVGCNGWVSVRAIYLMELRIALTNAGIDFSAVVNYSGGFNLNKKVKLEDNRFLLSEEVK